MARIEGHVTWLCVVVAMVVCGAEARRSLLQAVSSLVKFSVGFDLLGFVE
jgi:hypothetical protein